MATAYGYELRMGRMREERKGGRKGKKGRRCRVVRPPERDEEEDEGSRRATSPKMRTCYDPTACDGSAFVPK